MLRNYLIVALRGLLRHRMYTVVNVLGLSLAMASCIVLYLYIENELSYDRFHENAERIYRVSGDQRAIVPAVLGPTLLDHFGDQLDLCRLVRMPKTVSTGDGQLFHEDLVYYVDAAFPRVFTVAPLRGEAGSALTAPDAVVLSRRAAARYFGTFDALEEMLLVDGQPFRIAAIVDDYPHNSHFDFDVLLPIAAAPEWAMTDQWFLNVAHTYLLAPALFDETALESELTAVVEKASNGRFHPRLQRLTAIHLQSDLVNELGSNGDVARLYVVGAITAAILIIACINFVNLSTARYRERAREVGVRKVCGANRSQLVYQFLGESILLSVLSLAVGAALVEALLPTVNDTLALHLSVPYAELHLFATYVAIAAVIGLAAGAYAAFVLAAYLPAATLECDLAPLGPRDWLRRGLVVVQFAASIALMVCALVVQIQLRHMRDMDLGFDRGRLIVVNNAWNALGTHYESYKSEALAHRFVRAVTGGTVPGFFAGRSNISERRDGTILTVRDLEVDYNYVQTIGLRLVAGRGFTADRAADSSSACVVNRAYVAALPAEDDQLAAPSGLCKEIIGVVENFHTASLFESITPAAIMLRPRVHMSLLARAEPGEIEGAVAHLEETWGRFVKDHPFRYSLLKDDLTQVYDGERRFGLLISGFTAISMLISCMGMYGLATFIAERRTREIGARRVLGATVSQVMWLLSSTFGKLVFIAAVVASPIAYVAAGTWLEGFAYRVILGPVPFLACAAVAMVVGVTTVSSQAARAALRNPVEALRND